MSLISDIEDAQIARVVDQVTDLATVATLETQLDMLELGKMTIKMPFCLWRYERTTPVDTERLQDGNVGLQKMTFFSFIGASSLRDRKDSQRGCYTLVDAVEAAFEDYIFSIGDRTFKMVPVQNFFFTTENNISVYAIEWEIYLI